MSTVLKCHCLNVTIHVQGGLPGRSVDVERLRQEIGREHGILQGDVMEMDLDLEGVVMELASIVSKEALGDHQFFTCCGCGVHTHGIQQHKPGRLIVSGALKHRQEDIDALRSSTLFSPIFQVLLPREHAVPDVAQIRRTRSGAMQQAQQVLEAYMSRERAAVEDRIRQFIEEQQLALAKLKHRSHQDLQAVFHAMSCAIPSTSPDEKEAEQDCRISPTYVTDRPQNMSTVRTSHSAKSRLEDHEADIGMFMMDDVDDGSDQAPRVSDSEDETLESSGNLSEEQNNPGLSIVRNSLQPFVPDQIAASLPLNVPGSSRNRSLLRRLESDPDDGLVTPSMDDMGNSIKALARSVTDQSTAMFGELPRPLTLTHSFMSDAL